MDLKQINDKLNQYIRPQTFPLAIGMYKKAEDLPEGTKSPKRDLGISVALCQALNMARRYGWTIRVSREDQACPHGQVVLGFVPSEGYLDGTLAEEAGLEKKEVFALSARRLSLLPYGKYSHLVAAPIDHATFQPDLIMLYGNPAQIVRLVQGYAAAVGGSLTCNTEGGRGCSIYIAKTLVTGDCQIVLPGAGDRYFGLTQDHEMAFTLPMGLAEKVVQGLETTHKLGLRYPTPSWLKFEGALPNRYYAFTELLAKQKPKS
jgi:uncharacterized protein (DUF169 family)